MSLKILMDPIYSGLLTGCSSAYKCKTLIQHARKQGRDWFFYWLVPPNLSEAEKAWLPTDPEVDALLVSRNGMIASDKRQLFPLPTRRGFRLAV